MNASASNERTGPMQRTDKPTWDFLTNHAHVLLCVAKDPGTRLRDIADAVGITERATHRILNELVEDGYVLKERQGRRNIYEVVAKQPMPHPLVEDHEVGELLRLLIGFERRDSPRKA